MPKSLKKCLMQVLRAFKAVWVLKNTCPSLRFPKQQQQETCNTFKNTDFWSSQEGVGLWGMSWIYIKTPQPASWYNSRRHHVWLYLQSGEEGYSHFFGKQKRIDQAVRWTVHLPLYQGVRITFSALKPSCSLVISSFLEYECLFSEITLSVRISRTYFIYPFLHFPKLQLIQKY